MLRCRRCASEYRSEDIDLKLALAKCHKCHGVTDLSGRSVQLVGASAMPTVVPTVRRLMPKPGRFNVAEVPGGFTVSWKWFRPAAIFMTVFAVFWIGFLVVWNAVAIGSGAWQMSLFSVVHVAVGVWLGLYTAALWLNTTTVTLQQGFIRVNTQPIKFLVAKDQHLAASAVEQLFCREHVHRNKNSVSYSYSLNAMLKNGKEQVLFKRLDAVGEALWLEHELERALEIVDRPVTGEVREKDRISA